MDTSDPLIEFDSQGICNHCKNFDSRFKSEVFKGEDAKRRLTAIVETIKTSGKNKDYDCILGVSGGVDSTMLAYSVKKLGLRPLAVHFDNGWNSELAVDNIKNALDKLGIDLYTHVVDWEEFRDLQLSFLKASVANCEIPTDHAITALLFNMANKHGIKYIIGGGNVVTEGILPKAWGYYSQDLKHLSAIHKRFGKIPLKTLPKLGIFRFLYYVLVKKIKMIPLLNYLEYNKAEAIDTITRELGWRNYGGKHYESIYTRFFQGYILPKKFGYDKRRAHLSTLVCAGQLSREDALNEIMVDPYAKNNLNEDRNFVIKKFGLSEDEFQQIFSSPPKHYSEYPSNDLFFERLKHLKAVFKKIATNT